MAHETGPPELTHRCSFCGKPYTQVKRLFSGHNSYICNECVTLCSDLLTAAPDSDAAEEITNWREAEDGTLTEARLDEHVERDVRGACEDGTRRRNGCVVRHP